MPYLSPMSGYGKDRDLYIRKAMRIQLFRERMFPKHVHATIPKGNMGYDQYSVPDTVAVEPTFVAFL